MRPISEDFIWGVVLSLLVITVAILALQFSNNMNMVFNLIFVLMAIDLVAMSYYIMYLSRAKLSPDDRIKELEIKLKAIKLGKKEAEKDYYKRKINEQTFSNIVQDYNKEEILAKTELKSIQSKK